MFLTILFYAFVAVTSIQLVYFFSFSSALFKKKQNNKEANNISISVVICAKNEAKNLSQFLPSILEQEYPNFEIVLINDASSDNTLEVMEAFKEKNTNIKIVNVVNNEAFWGNKKYALTLGIKAATHQHLLFTDADCKANSKYWIQQMAMQYTEQKSIILGYGKYLRKKSLVNLFVRFETLLTAIQYFSYAKLGSPYMGVGRNLAYHKDEFFKTKGFINHIKVRSGDDDLFIQEAATKKNTTFSLNPESFTLSNPPKNFKDWFIQKRRHVSTSSYYKFKHKFFLGLFFISKICFYILTSLLYFFISWKIITPFVLAYFITLFIVYGLYSKKLQEKQLIFFLPFLEVGLLLFQFIIFISNTFSKPTHWK